MDIQTVLSGIQARIFLAICLLFIAGFLYQELIEVARRRKYLEGFAWLAVIGWAAICLAGLAFVSLEAAGLALIAFAAAGLPCAGGEIWRYWRRREYEQDRLRLEAQRGWVLVDEIRKQAEEDARQAATLAE